MRNIMKPAATASSRTRRSVRGVAAVVASLALAAGLGSYPVDAQEPVASTTTAESAVASENAEASETAPASETTTAAEPAVSETGVAEAVAPAAQTAGPMSATQPAVADKAAVQTTRFGAVDTITIDDPTGEAWQFGGKASPEDIFGIKRIGDGEIEEILSFIADGKNLDPESYGFTNNAEGGYIAFDLNALDEVPPKHIEVKVRTTDAGDYAIAESADVPTVRELSASGYGQNRGAAVAGAPTSVGQARATNDTKWSEEIKLSSEIVAAGKQKFENIGTEPYFEVRPTGEHPDQVGRDIRITRVVVRNIEDNTRRANNRAMIVKNDAADEQFYFKDAPEVRNEKNRIKGFEAAFFDPETGESPVAQQLIIYSGQDSIKIGVDGVPAWSDNLDTLRQRYAVEVYGSFRIPTEPTPPETSPTEEEEAPTVDDENKSFIMEGQGGIRLSPAKTTGENPYESTTTVDGKSTFSKAVVRVSAPNSILAIEGYTFDLDKTEPGTSFERRVISASRDYVEYEVYPVQNGARVDSVDVPNGAKFTMTSKFSDKPKSVDVVATIHGTSEPKPAPEIPESRPDGADWLNEQVPNPEMPKKCGLKIAIVADHSRSLEYADKNGFEQSRLAALTMVQALKDAPGTEVGIYTFNTFAPADKRQQGSTNGPVPVLKDGEINPAITSALDDWNVRRNRNSTNWEAGLSQVEKDNYDVVYFITDGMPTHDNDGWQNYGGNPNNELLPGGGAFVQATSLNRAILAANRLKASGTRVVPILVDLVLGGGNTVERDYILKDVISYQAIQNTGVDIKTDMPLFQTKQQLAPYPNPERAMYPNNLVDVVNVEEAIAVKRNGTSNSDHLLDFITPNKKNLTSDKKEWTYGLRTVKQMGEDISGPGDTINVKKYSLLAAQLEQIANEIKQLCKGRIIVQKQIVDGNGNVLTDGAKDWEFSVMANRSIIDAGNNDLVYADSKKTAKEEGADKPQASWNLVTDKPATATITEYQQDGYKLYPQRNEKNARCTQTLNGQESELEVQNTGDTGFRVPVNTSGDDVATVFCVVANTKTDQPKFGLQVKKVDLDNRSTTLSDAKFEVREVAAAEGKTPQTWNLEPGTEAGTYTLDAVLEPGKEYDLVEVKAPTQDGVVYSLLTAPVRFRGTVQDQGVAVEYESDGKWVSDISTQGVWSLVSDKKMAYLEVANVRQGDLPKTGGAGLQLPILLGGALIAAGALVGRRKVAA